MGIVTPGAAGYVPVERVDVPEQSVPDDADRQLERAVKEMPDGWHHEDAMVALVREALLPPPGSQVAALQIDDANATAILLELMGRGLLVRRAGMMYRRR